MSAVPAFVNNGVMSSRVGQEERWETTDGLHRSLTDLMAGTPSW